MYLESLDGRSFRKYVQYYTTEVSIFSSQCKLIFVRMGIICSGDYNDCWFGQWNALQDSTSTVEWNVIICKVTVANCCKMRYGTVYRDIEWYNSNPDIKLLDRTELTVKIWRDIREVLWFHPLWYVLWANISEWMASMHPSTSTRNLKLWTDEFSEPKAVDAPFWTIMVWCVVCNITHHIPGCLEFRYNNNRPHTFIFETLHTWWGLNVIHLKKKGNMSWNWLLRNETLFQISSFLKIMMFQKGRKDKSCFPKSNVGHRKTRRLVRTNTYAASIMFENARNMKSCAGTLYELFLDMHLPHTLVISLVHFNDIYPSACLNCSEEKKSLPLLSLDSIFTPTATTRPRSAQPSRSLTYSLGPPIGRSIGTDVLLGETDARFWKFPKFFSHVWPILKVCITRRCQPRFIFIQTEVRDATRS